MKRTLTTIFLCLLLATPAWAHFYEGLAAYKRGDYTTALREHRPLAEQGHASAQYNLGVMYYTGQGVRQEDAVAQYKLGVMYGTGDGVALEFTKESSGFRTTGR